MDRYSMVEVKEDNLIEMINSAKNLGLKWFIQGDRYRAYRLYLFLDEDAMIAYLRNEFGDGVATAREWVRQNIPGGSIVENTVSAVELVKFVAEKTRSGDVPNQ